MSGFCIGIGLGLRYIKPSNANGTINASDGGDGRLCCFGTGKWIDEGVWINSDTWKMQPTEEGGTEIISCFGTGQWVNDASWINTDTWKLL